MTDKTVSVRLPPELQEKIARWIATETRRRLGVRLTDSDAIRALLFAAPDVDPDPGA